MHPKKSYFEYLEKKHVADKVERQDVMSSFPMNNYPKELNKKVTLLQHFKNYLEEESNQDNMPSVTKNEENADDTGAPLVYLKKWMKTRHAILFRLSNKIVQVLISI